MYKDPDKQREANRERQRRYRAERGRKAYPKGVTQSVTDVRRDKEGVTEGSTLTGESVVVAIKAMSQAAGKAERAEPKRGKDIKVFADLPPDIQETIWSLSRRDGKVNPIEVANRAAIAINYQHLFPDNYHSTGVAI